MTADVNDLRILTEELARLGEISVMALCLGTENGVTEGDVGDKEDMSLVAWEAPYEELAEVAEVAHINAMADKDGIIRHNLLPVETPDGTVYSFARVIYEKYAEAMGFEPNPMPITDEDGFFYFYGRKNETVYQTYQYLPS